jgi:hypothetical protein
MTPKMRSYLEAFIGWGAIIVICASIVVLWAGTAKAQRWGGNPVITGGAECGLPPLPPLPPPGCRDLVPICVCDSNGNCRIVWQCVPW